MPAEVLHCPACGAAASSEAVRCSYCGATLATVACPACFGMMFVGTKFCSHCGAAASRTETTARAQGLCPRCQVAMKTAKVGGSTFLECTQCAGLWLDPETLRKICTEQEKQAAVLGMAPSANAPGAAVPIRYVPCPVCHALMNRVNFAHSSSVIVDVCKPHGTWFDKDELRRTVEFIRAGGLEKARTQQLAEIEDERRKLAAERTAAAAMNSVTLDEPRFGRSPQSLLDVLRNLLD